MWSTTISIFPVNGEFLFPLFPRLSNAFFLPKKIVGNVPTVRKGFIKELTATKHKRKVQQEA